MGTKRYDVGGRPAGGRRTYPEGTILKLDDAEAKAMGLTEKNVSNVKLTSDDLAKRDRYDEAMTSQGEMRATEAARTEAEAAAETAATDAANKKRTTR